MRAFFQVSRAASWPHAQPSINGWRLPSRPLVAVVTHTAALRSDDVDEADGSASAHPDSLPQQSAEVGVGRERALGCANAGFGLGIAPTCWRRCWRAEGMGGPHLGGALRLRPA